MKRFHCTRCGTCCRWPGQVRLTDQDTEAIASQLGMAVEAFTDSYTRLTSDRRGLTLVEAADGACIFLEPDNRCRINDAKPRQCREFPHTWNFPGWQERCPGRFEEPRQDPSPPDGVAGDPT